MIIPVYNAGPYVRKAVESALEQPETAEVLLVEDGSPDNSLEVCKEIDAEYEKVRLFTHENNANLGAGPTRNVGIENARFEYIAFLDADDFYLPDRFRAERRIFTEDPEADGVYGAAGYWAYSKEASDFYFSDGYRELCTITKELTPLELFEAQIGFSISYGTIHLDTLTVSRDVFTRTTKFSSIRLAQDVDFLWRLSYKCSLVGGSLETPVAMIGIHDRNRMVRVPKGSRDREIMIENIREWAIVEGLPTKYISYFSNLNRWEKLKAEPRFSALLKFVVASLRTDSILRHKLLTKACIRHILEASPNTR